jgi:hypothetical protein
MSLTQAKHVIVQSQFEREDGMAAIRVKPRQGAPFWVLRAPVQGQTRFWNGQEFILTSLIKHEETSENGYWPSEYRFSKEEALALLEDLDAP